MKINLNSDFEDIGEKPKKSDRWNRWGHRDNLKIDHATPYVIAKRILKKYTNKSFADAFSEFCEIVPKYKQYIFLEEFQNYESGHRSYLDRFYNWYMIDEKGIVRCVKEFNKYKGPYKFVSIDAEYETHYVNRITGAVYVVTEEKKKKNPYSLEPWSWMNKNPVNKRENWDMTVYIVKGYELIFKSKKDPLYVRLKAEKQKIRKAMNRAAKKQNIKDWDATLKHYSVEMEKRLEKEEMNELEKRKRAQAIEDAENLQKIISHGFDPKTSFRTFSGSGGNVG
jgi:hypothetical protein